MSAASGTDPYCSVDQLVGFVDERAVRQLLSDTDAPYAGDLTESTVLASILRRSSGEVESAACAGQRYLIDDTRNDLADLTGNSAEFLAGLVADLAFFRLWSRRPNNDLKLPASCEQAQEFLERLRLGERVFGNLEDQEAAAISADQESASDVLARGGPTVIAERFFGVRSNRYSPFRS